MFDTARLLLQIAAIISVSRAFAWVLGRMGQPQVIGEMLAGIALGPTLLGVLAPELYRQLFPAESLGYLNALSQPGVVIFVFIVGLRVDFAELRNQTGLTLASSVISIIVPFSMGFLLAQYLYPRYGNGQPLAFALFLGTAMSVTAFPVLARILTELNLLNTRLGVIAISCAAFDDIAAWVMLTAILALAGNAGSVRPVWMTLVLLLLVFVAAQAAARVLRVITRRLAGGTLGLGGIAIFVVLTFLAGAAGEWMNIHPLTGAFIAGLITPRQFRRELIGSLEPVTLLLLVPVFFALTGIRTNLAFASMGGAWLDLLLILVTAVASKWGACALTARARGLPWSDASKLGLLLNTRGLVELVVLNIGLEKGILRPALFSLMVAMALVTTLMATPLITREKSSAAAV